MVVYDEARREARLEAAASPTAASSARGGPARLALGGALRSPAAGLEALDEEEVIYTCA